jgi:hypothetical protein
VTATLADAFESVEQKILGPLAACMPVDKNGAGQLVCHKVRRVSGQPDFVAREVVVHDQLGAQRLSLRRPRSLCVPAEGDGAMPPFGLDHFKCYRARAAGRLNRSVFVVDPFEATTVRLIKPIAFCTAVDAGGSGVPTANAALTCFKVRAARGAPPFAPRDLVLDGGLGTEPLTVMRAHTLCLPSVVAP